MITVKTTLMLLAAAVALLGQPVTTGTNPQVELGSTLYNMGTIRVYTGTGAPTTVTTPTGTAPQQGDFYIDTAARVVYQCIPASCVSSGWSKTTTAISVTAFGINGTSTDAANFNSAIAATAGVTCLYIPTGVTVNVTSNSITVLTNTCIIGDGPLSKITASGLSTTGIGIMDVPVNQTGVILKNFSIDGGVTSPVGVTYTTASSNGPMYSGFTTGSTFWLHGGNNGFSAEGVQISHTNGYGMLFDGSSVGGSGIRLRKMSLINNRPNLFGSSLPATYGSWTGGIFFYSSGTDNTKGWSDVIVEDSTWQNDTGNCLWMGHTAGGTPVPTNFNFRFSGNTFIDVGLDSILVTGLEGYTETNNKTTRGGYVITSDVGNTRVGGPMWLQGYEPVAYDTYYPLVNFIRDSNWAEQCGTLSNLDGASNGTISHNTLISSFLSNDPLSASGSCGPSSNVGTNFVGGITTANTSGFGISPRNITIIGNEFFGTGYIAIALYPCTYCVITNNTIYQTANNGTPITIANVSTTGIIGHSNSNLVSGNNIYWNPISSSPAIIENCQPSSGTCQYPFFSSDFNFVRGNAVFGNVFEFQRNPTAATGGNADASGSGSLTLNSVTPGNTAAINGIVLQSEGTGNPFLNFYLNNGGGTLLYTVSPSGNIDQVVHFANLPLVVGAGYRVYCDNCTPGSSPCTSGGSGHQAVTNGSIWTCN
jgi:hypothetical protein